MLALATALEKLLVAEAIEAEEPAEAELALAALLEAEAALAAAEEALAAEDAAEAALEEERAMDEDVEPAEREEKVLVAPAALLFAAAAIELEAAMKLLVAAAQICWPICTPAAASVALQLSFRQFWKAVMKLADWQYW